MSHRETTDEELCVGIKIVSHFFFSIKKKNRQWEFCVGNKIDFSYLIYKNNLNIEKFQESFYIVALLNEMKNAQLRVYSWLKMSFNPLKKRKEKKILNLADDCTKESWEKF